MPISYGHDKLKEEPEEPKESIPVTMGGYNLDGLNLHLVKEELKQLRLMVKVLGERVTKLEKRPNFDELD